jgi:hypothetical protein
MIDIIKTFESYPFINNFSHVKKYTQMNNYNITK